MDRSRSPQGKRKDERDREGIPAGQVDDEEDDPEVGGGARNGNMNQSIPLPLSMVQRWLINDDKLGDECWNSETREANEQCRGVLFFHCSRYLSSLNAT